MLASARTFTIDGVAAREVGVEVDVHRGLPAFSIVGLPDAAVRESRERVRAALVNCGFEFPLRRITVNLAPADLPKAGAGLELATAAALMAACGQLPGELGPGLALAGELALDGTVRPIPGVLAMAEAARAAGAERLVVATANGSEAALIEGLTVLPLERLDQLPSLLAGEWRPAAPCPLDLDQPAGGPDILDLRGQPSLRRALEVAAAGGHSLLMVGPPGAGKSRWPPAACLRYCRRCSEPRRWKWRGSQASPGGSTAARRSGARSGPRTTRSPGPASLAAEIRPGG